MSYIEFVQEKNVPRPSEQPRLYLQTALTAGCKEASKSRSGDAAEASAARLNSLSTLLGPRQSFVSSPSVATSLVKAFIRRWDVIVVGTPSGSRQYRPAERKCLSTSRASSRMPPPFRQTRNDIERAKSESSAPAQKGEEKKEREKV